jgi:hypothetical protein
MLFTTYRLYKKQNTRLKNRIHRTLVRPCSKEYAKFAYNNPLPPYPSPQTFSSTAQGIEAVSF